jgi:hypothetical protein
VVRFTLTRPVWRPSRLSWDRYSSLSVRLPYGEPSGRGQRVARLHPPC